MSKQKPSQQVPQCSYQNVRYRPDVILEGGVFGGGSTTKYDTTIVNNMSGILGLWRKTIGVINSLP
jgi:hypothetical protein